MRGAVRRLVYDGAVVPRTLRRASVSHTRLIVSHRDRECGRIGWILNNGGLECQWARNERRGKLTYNF